MKRILLLNLCLLCAQLSFADRPRSDHALITKSGDSKPLSVGAANAATFEELIQGSPSTVSIVLKGCMAGNTCDTLEANTDTTAAQLRNPTITKLYDYFWATASWTGGTDVSVVINATAVAASIRFGIPGGSDTQVQFNDGGVFGGASDFYWDKVNNQVVLGDKVLVGSGQLLGIGSSGDNLDGIFTEMHGAGAVGVYSDTTGDGGVALRGYATGGNSPAGLFVDTFVTDTSGAVGINVAANVDSSNSSDGADAQGIQANALSFGTGAVTSLIGIRAVPNARISGTLSTSTGIQIDDQHGQGSNNYALKIANQGTGANDWAIKIDGGKSEFDGPIISGPVGFTSLPSCAAGTEGMFRAVNDANTATWGATITAGSSTNHVLAYCDGSNWTVMAK